MRPILPSEILREDFLAPAQLSSKPKATKTRPLAPHCIFRSVVLAASLLFVHHAQATCNTESLSTTPTKRFALFSETALDRQTGLVWARCPVGMTWNKNKCDGDIRLMGLADAQKYAATLKGGWRVPSLDELQSIVDFSCSNPAINSAVFPGVVDLWEGKAKFWTDTVFQPIPDLVYDVDFIDGTVDANTRGISMGVRLVRNATKSHQ